MKKIIFFSLIIMLLAVIPNVRAAETYGTVRDITKNTGDSLSSGKGTLETKGNTTTIRYSAATFKMLEEDKDAADGNRPGPAAWIGFEVEEPTNQKDSSYKVTTPDNKTTVVKTSPYKDYVGITPENLKKSLLNGTVLRYKFAFDWDENDIADQFVIIEIDPEGITLLSADDQSIVWSNEIAKKILEEQNPNTSDINIFYLFGIIIICGSLFTYYLKKS